MGQPQEKGTSVRCEIRTDATGDPIEGQKKKNTVPSGKLT